MMVLQDKFLAVEKDLNGVLFERETEIHCAILAILAKRHILLFGSPGIAKSFLVDELSRRIVGAENFKWLLTKFSVPEEIYGPPDLMALKDSGVYRRITTGKLPTAFTGFLDETFKANSAILNTLLKILNEGEFDNPGDDPRVPLNTLFGASNELPTSAELNALADRLHFWLQVQPIKESSNLVKMLTTKPREPEAVVTLDDIRQAQSEISEVQINNDILDVLISLIDKLRDDGIDITDRRLHQSLDIIRAEAWLDGQDTVGVRHIHPLQNMFWRDPTEIDRVRQAVLDLADPIERAVLELQTDWDTSYSKYQDTLKDEEIVEGTHRKLTYEITNKYKECKKELSSLKKKAKESGQDCRALTRFEDRLRAIGPELLSVGFGLDIEKAKEKARKMDENLSDE